ncbi:hypothetical protein GBAR_LOCUS16039, partial [Geodia barretti]
EFSTEAAVLISTVLNISQSNQDIKAYLEAVSKRLDSLEEMTRQSPNDTTGSFLNPAHNCHHIQANIR